MNKEQQELLDEVYENYVKWWEKSDDSCNLTEEQSNKWLKLIDGGLQWTPFSQEEFINKCKTDTEFSEKWGLKIEERELSFKERRDLSYEYAIKNNAIPLCIDAYGEKGIPKYMETINNTGWNIPNKLITITYNDKTIESYEQPR